MAAASEHRLPHPLIRVSATWDDEAAGWVASTIDIPGLAVEAPTIELLGPKVKAALLDLIELNNVTHDFPELFLHLTAQQSSRLLAA